MKKLKLSELNLGHVKVLSREELKNVLGGISPKNEELMEYLCYKGCSADGHTWGEYTGKHCVNDEDCASLEGTYTCSDGGTPFYACE